MHAPATPLIPAETLLAAYRGGIFPMADSREDDEIFWVEPRRRAIIPLEGFRCSRSLAKVLRKERFQVSCDADFHRVITACAEPRPDHPESWISHTIVESYCRLHALGHAHSVECWQGEDLVGGLYGVAFGQVFCGESMFSRARDASKVALAWLVYLLSRAGYRLLDCQFLTDHLASMGAVEIARDTYRERLLQARDDPPRQTLPQAYESLLAESSSPGKLIAQSFTHTS